MRAFLLLTAISICVERAQAQTSLPRVRISETLRLDANQEDFSAVGPVKIGPSGQIAITFRQDAQVRVYDSTGKRLTTFGRKGQGPGEFNQMQVQGWRGDSVWVYDYRQYRHTLLTQSGRLVRTTPMAAGLVVLSAKDSGTLTSTFTPHAMFPDGSTLGLACVRAPSNGSQLGVVRADQTGEATVVMSVPTKDACQRKFGVRNPLTFQPQAVFRSDGSLFAQLRVDNLVRTGGTFIIDVFEGTGRRVLSKAIPYAGEPLPSRVADSLIATMMPSRQNDPEGLLRQGATEGMAKARANVPPVYVPITGMIFGQDGTMWVLLRARAEQTSALVLDAAGNQLAVVALPPRTELLAASAKQLWVRERDDDGLTSIVRYRAEGIVCGPRCSLTINTPGVRRPSQ